MAVVLLCLAFVERELAAQLHVAGWERAKKAKLGTLLKRAYSDGVLSELDWRTFSELALRRNAHAHFRAPNERTSLTARAVQRSRRGGARERRKARSRGDGEDCETPVRWPGSTGFTGRISVRSHRNYCTSPHV